MYFVSRISEWKYIKLRWKCWIIFFRILPTIYPVFLFQDLEGLLDNFIILICMVWILTKFRSCLSVDLVHKCLCSECSFLTICKATFKNTATANMKTLSLYKSQKYIYVMLARNQNRVVLRIKILDRIGIVSGIEILDWIWILKFFCIVPAIVSY